jgi:hypothetical protein
MSKASFGSMPAGRPSQTKDRSRLLAGLRDTTPAEPLKRVNFEIPESKHTKLKVNAARNGQTVKDFLTAYIDGLPE